MRLALFVVKRVICAQQDNPDDENTINDERKVDVKDKQAEVTEEETDHEDSVERYVFHSYIADLKQKDSEWKGKLGRPNFKDMGLNIRALQNAGVMEPDIKCFASADDDPHAESRESLKNKNFARGKTDEEITRYKMLKDQLAMDTLRKTKGVITTCSKTADSKLKTAKIFVVANH